MREKNVGAKKRITFFGNITVDEGAEGRIFPRKKLPKITLFRLRLVFSPLNPVSRERHASLDDPLSPIAATASEPKQRVTGSTEATDNNLPPRACAFQIIGNRKFPFPMAYGQGTGRTFSFRRTSSSWAPRNALALSIISRGRRTRGRKLGKFSSDAVMGQAFREYLFGTLKFASGS